MEEVTLKIDGINVSSMPGTSILQAAAAVGIKIPSLCFHPKLKPFGACRLCLVEETSSGRLYASCVTPVAPGMVVLTYSERVLRHRKNIIRLMMAEHPESCLVCSKGNRCKLREMAAELGIGETKLYPMPNVKNFEQVNPFIVRDLSKCILCGKCIRIDHELVVVGAIDYNLRGFESRPLTLYDRPLEDSSCTFCGSCVSACPTGALSPKIDLFVGTPEKESISVCGFCGVGCLLCIGSVNDRVVEVNPSNIQESVNGSTLCVRGHFAHDFLDSNDRIQYPLLRTNEGWKRISWDAALKLVATKLQEIKKRYGPASLAFLGSSKCTNEENYLFQKMARALIGTNNIDSGGYISGRFALQTIRERLGKISFRRPLSSIDQAGVILVLGADPTQSAPVAGYYIKRASRDGLPLVEINPRITGLSFLSSLRLEIIPNGDLAIMTAISRCLVEKGWIDHQFINEFTTGFEPFRETLLSLDHDLLCQNAGIKAEYVDKVCDLIKGKKVAIVVGSGVLRQRFGPSVLNRILDLALITGSLGERGGIYVLARDCNEVGAWDMGSAPDFLPGPVPVSSEKNRREIERLWGAKLSPDPGLNTIRIIEEAEKGRLKALYIIGENILRSLPGEPRIKKAFDKLEFLVVQEIFKNETSEIADLILPGAAAAEKDGSFTNLEGRIQCFSCAVKPPGEALADWEILDKLMVLLGQKQKYGSIPRIRREIAKIVPKYAPLADGLRGDLRGFEVQDVRIPFSSGIEQSAQAKEGPFSMTVVFGSSRFHLGSGTRTKRSKRIAKFYPEGFAEVSGQDCERLGVQEGDSIRIQNQNGSVVKNVRVNREQSEGLIFVPWGFDDNDAKSLIHLAQFDGKNFEGWNSCKANVQKM